MIAKKRKDTYMMMQSIISREQQKTILDYIEAEVQKNKTKFWYYPYHKSLTE